MLCWNYGIFSATTPFIRYIYYFFISLWPRLFFVELVIFRSIWAMFYLCIYLDMYIYKSLEVLFKWLVLVHQFSKNLKMFVVSLIFSKIKIVDVHKEILWTFSIFKVRFLSRSTISSGGYEINTSLSNKPVAQGGYKV